jgi:hypothetical protein
MDYLIMKDIAALILVLVCVGVAFYSSLRLSRSGEEHQKKMMELLKHSIDTIKSTSLEERVNAVALEGQHEVQLEMLKDALAQEQEVADEERDPHYVHTDEGARIDLHEYEIL